MKIKRRKTKEVMVGSVGIGGNNPVRVQSMCNTETKDVNATIKQIRRLEVHGCEIVRIAVPDVASAKCIGNIKSKINIPLVADIHYDYKLALESIEQGIDKIRINPGNISKGKLGIIIQAAKKAEIPIRIGVNIGSLPKPIVKKYGNSARAMVEAALDTIKYFEKQKFNNIVVSLKSSDILQTIEANKVFSKRLDCPLHLGITEAGTLRAGAIKSGIGLGCLLINGIGDTIRVSLSADPTEEVLAGFDILKSLDLRKGVQIISCPTCGRAKIDVIKIAKELEKRMGDIDKSIKIGVLGCLVNQEEAKIADIGIAGAGKGGILFRDGIVVRKVEENRLVEELVKEINRIDL